MSYRRDTKFGSSVKRIDEYSPRELQMILLHLVGAGILIGVLIVAPNLALLYRYFKAHRREEQRKLYFATRYLERGGYIAPGTSRYVLTKKGQRQLTEDEVWSLTPAHTKKWDGIWHFVLFDIPAKQERARQALRARLEELGCVRYQDSVYAHQFDMSPLIAPFAVFYGIRTRIQFVDVKKLENERDLLARFVKAEKRTV